MLMRALVALLLASLLLCACGSASAPLASPVHRNESSTEASVPPTAAVDRTCGHVEWRAIVEVVDGAEQSCASLRAIRAAGESDSPRESEAWIELSSHEDMFFEVVMAWEDVCPGVDRSGEMMTFETDVVTSLRCET